MLFRSRHLPENSIHLRETSPGAKPRPRRTREAVASKAYPSRREKSRSNSYIASLVAQGNIRKDPAKPRALVLVDQYEPGQTGSSYSNTESACEETVEIPIVGNVAAGQPILAEENIEDSLSVPARYVNGRNYMLRVRGESMINAGIFDGDLILVEQAETARNGEIVVAMVDGFESEATVKTFYKENGHVRLQPENDVMSPIIVKDAKILGKVRGVFRYYN